MKLIERTITITITSTEEKMNCDLDHVLSEIKKGYTVGFESRDDAKYRFDVDDKEGKISKFGQLVA